jgi:hypothetical protein
LTSRKKHTRLKEVVPALQNVVFNDQNANVLKAAILVASGLYKMCLQWVCEVKMGTTDARDAIAAWDVMCKLRDYIVKQIDSDNHG